MAVHQYNYPTRVRFGAGARHELGRHLKAFGATRPLFVTDRGVAALPWFAELVAAAEADFKVAVFSDMGGNPVLAQVDAGTQAIRAHQADAVVAVGGGAALDVAKVLMLMQHYDGHLWDYEDDVGPFPADDHPIVPLIALPTTAGTGSEVGRSSVISTDDTHQKKIIFTPRLLPPLVLADPELTLGLPAGVTAATGVDALTHLVEAFLAKGHHAMADGIALEGVRMVAESLVDAVGFAKRGHGNLSPAEQAAHVQARATMLEASMMGATAFQKGLGAVHSCAHALSTVCDTHHGLANALMFAPVLRFNMEVVPERLLRLARAVDPTATDGAQFIDWVEALKAKVGIPPTLSAAGVPASALDALVPVAVADACHPNNPRPCTAADFRRFYQEAY
ncbi:MAG: iron-containing alcohol dehydrogenase [Myxococcales bacterium]|nr:iron-containing alcohol dehydrogenase [Myxococcales bacterium]